MKELLQQLRRTRGMRRSRHYSMKTPTHGRITETVSISERPAEAEDRAVPGHWEGDLFFGSNNSQIATLVERQTRYLMLVLMRKLNLQNISIRDQRIALDATQSCLHSIDAELARR